MSEEEFKEILAQVDPVSWTETRRVLKGKPFSFQNRNYLNDIYRDEYQDIILMKGRQVECSELSMNWLLHKLDAHPYTAGVHAFPRDGQCNKFSKLRLDAAIKDSEYIKKWYTERESELKMRKFVKEPDDKGLIPYNFYLLGATWESRKDTVGDATRSMSVDFIVYDERQDHPNDVETVLGEGASHSEFKQTLTLGTPKLPGIQFDQEWESSDKRYWHIRCEHCGWTDMITMDNILDSGDDEVGYYYGCPHCRQPIVRHMGTWMPTHPQKRPAYHGYHINQLMVCWLSANEIMKKKLSTTYPKRRFHNEVLGEAYGGDDIPITWAMMEACANNGHKLGETDGGALYAGVDWGAASYLYIQDRSMRLVDCAVTDESDPREHPKKIAQKIMQYAPHVKKVVCDAGPDITRFYNLRDELKAVGFKGEVWACYYATPPAKTETSWNDKEMNVTVGRSEMIEKVIDQVHDGTVIIPGEDKNLERVDMLMEHFTNIAAEKAETKSGNAYIMYVATGPDHFLHAKVYADVASDGVVSTPLSGSAPPANNPRPQIGSTQNGLLLPNSNIIKAKSIFPVFNMRRRR
jgi:hypothetical protein